MSPKRAWRVLRKELRMGPRSPVFLYAIALPVVLTLLVSAVFGGLLAPKPALGIVDLGASELTAAARELPGIDVDVLDEVDSLQRRVENHDLDAGLVLPPGFDESVRAGEVSDLEFFVSGESLASNRVVLAVATLDLIRGIAGQQPPVQLMVTSIGDEDYVPIGDRLLPMLLFYAVVIAGLFLPAAALMEEREKGTLQAMLATPTRLSEVLVAKGALGAILGTVLGVVTLGLNDAFGSRPLELVLLLGIGSLMMAEVGLVLGLLVKDSNSLYAAVKGLGIVVFLPAAFALFPALPEWIARIAPTYYFLIPLYDLSVKGVSLGDVAVDVIAAVGICLLLGALIGLAARRSRERLAIEG